MSVANDCRSLANHVVDENVKRLAKLVEKLARKVDDLETEIRRLKSEVKTR